MKSESIEPFKTEIEYHRYWKEQYQQENPESNAAEDAQHPSPHPAEQAASGRSRSFNWPSSGGNGVDMRWGHAFVESRPR